MAKYTVEINGTKVAVVSTIDQVHSTCKQHGHPVRYMDILSQGNTDVYTIGGVTIYANM